MGEDIMAEVEALLERVLEQGRFLDKTLRDPELARPDVIESMALEFILKAVNAFAVELYRPGDTTRFQRVLADIQSMHADLARRRLDVNLHLSDLATGWTCTGCGYSIPREARIRGLSRPPVEILLRCKVCDRETGIKAEGYEAFTRLFGPLQAAGPWNPRANKFTWKGD